MEILRKKRKDVFADEFCEKQEYRIYKYLCGEKLWFWELKGLEMFYKYADWKKHIENKYRDFNKEQLEEFQKYINHKKRQEKHSVEMNSMIFSVVFTVFITNGLLGFLRPLLAEKNILTLCIAFAISILIMFFSTSIVVKVVDHVIFKPKIKYLFYEDYYQVIDDVITKSRNQPVNKQTNSGKI